MTRSLETYARTNPYIELRSLGWSSSGKRRIWMVRVGAPAVRPSQTVKIVALFRQHGDEPATTEAALALLRRFDAGGDSKLRSELRHVTLYIIPMVNPDGADANTRDNAQGADLNRDWGHFTQPETRDVNRAITAIRPDVVIDNHNWDASDSYNANCIETSRDDLSGSGRACNILKMDLLHKLSSLGYQVESTGFGPYASGTLAHRYYANRGALSMLVETHSGSPYDAVDFERRQGIYTAILHDVAGRFASATSAPLLDTVRRVWDTRTDDGFDKRAPEHGNALIAKIHAKSFPHWLWPIVAYAFVLLLQAVGRLGRGAQTIGPYSRVKRTRSTYSISIRGESAQRSTRLKSKRFHFASGSNG